MVSRIIGKMNGKVWAEMPQEQDGPGLVMAIDLPSETS